MRALCHRFTSLFLPTLLLLGFALPSPAADSNTQWIEDITLELRYIEQLFENATETGQTGDEQLKALTQIKGKAQSCVDDYSEQLRDTSTKLEALGEANAEEPASATQKRNSLQEQQREHDKILNSCNLLAIQSGDLINQITKRKTEELAKRLFTREAHLGTVLQHNLQKPTAWWQPGLSYLFDKSGLEAFSIPQLTVLILLAAGALMLGIFLRSVFKRRLANTPTFDDSYSGFMMALRSCVSRFMPFLLPLLVAAAFIFFVNNDLRGSFLNILVLSANALVMLVILTRAVLSPCPPAQHFLKHPAELARKLSHRLILALLITWLGFLFFGTPLKDQFDTEAYFLIRSTLLTLLVINLVLINWMTRHFSWTLLPGGLRVLISLALIATVLADYIGYKNFSRYLLTGITGTVFSLVLTVMLNRFIADFFDQLDSGRQRWQKKLRDVLGLKSGEHVPGLVWLRLMTFLSFWGLFIIAVLQVWGWSHQGEALIIERLTQGFSIGTIRIIPSRLILAILFFALILSLVRLIKQNLGKRWIKHTNLDRGAQEAMVTISGYLGFLLALMVALSTLGVEFKNIAIVAGALSVGIGFGLQNIVNNFVSGLILLFERPIRRGDWIVVGNTEGYVKSINIRSTEIQTFDRADVIVPNSELISGQVTNWVLHDSTGRVKLPVGVAYGSDVELVKRLLLKVANDHPDIISDSSFITPPFVLFRRFGDNSLDFELRCFIRNVDRRLVVTSDMNFAIYKAFKDNGIEIPYPQRTVHIVHDKPDGMPESAEDNQREAKNPEPGK